MRVATWNMKQAVAPRGRPPELWRWMEEEISPDVIVLTEAKVPEGGPPAGWQAVWEPDGIGPRRRWGTVVAGRGVDLVPVTEVTVGRFRKRTVPLTPRIPAAAVVTDALVGGQLWATVVGLYGLTTDLTGTTVGHGRDMVPALLEDLAPLFESDRRERIIVAGDFNLWPCDMPRIVHDLGLVDLASVTGDERPTLEGCSGCNAPTPDECGHFWTHRNGNSPNAAVQHIDFILATMEVAVTIEQLSGGIGDYPDAWDVSDHAPVVADFRR